MTRATKWLLALPIAGGVLVALAAGAYRAYAPGDLADRVGRAQARWSPFAQLGTWKFLGRGLALTLELAIVSICLSLVFAVVFALIRLSTHPRMRAPIPGTAIASRIVTILIEIIRSSPLFMLIIYTFIALPKIGVDLTPFWSGVLALTLYTTCVTSEIVRAGILSLERGQFDAALSLGMGYVARVRFVVLPQALRRMVPAIVSQLVTLIKDTSLVSFITVFELARRGQALQQLSNNPIETSLVLMAIYFAINFSLSQFSQRLELRQRRTSTMKAPAAIGSEDQIASVA
jgi:His/Glu/Gln/Arg/opine family amino acid ABC transporter permease subunit